MNGKCSFLTKLRFILESCFEELDREFSVCWSISTKKIHFSLTSQVPRNIKNGVFQSKSPGLYLFTNRILWIVKKYVSYKLSPWHVKKRRSLSIEIPLGSKKDILKSQLMMMMTPLITTGFGRGQEKKKRPTLWHSLIHCGSCCESNNTSHFLESAYRVIARHALIKIRPA